MNEKTRRKSGGDVHHLHPIVRPPFAQKARGERQRKPTKKAQIQRTLRGDDDYINKCGKVSVARTKKKVVVEEGGADPAIERALLDWGRRDGAQVDQVSHHKLYRYNLRTNGAGEAMVVE